MAEDKSTKDEAHYRAGTRMRHCGICTMFRGPDSCTAVQGVIEAGDVCDYFEASEPPAVYSMPTILAW